MDVDPLTGVVEDPLPQPEPSPAASNIVRFAQQRRQSAVLNALSSADDDPDEAAGSLYLAQDTGIPPHVVHNDRERILKLHRDDIIRGLIGRSPALQAHIEKSPLADKVSNDDWGQLSDLAISLGKHIAEQPRDMLNILGAAYRGFEKFHGVQPPLTGIYGPKGMYNPEPAYMGETPLERAVTSLLLYFPEEGLRILAGGTGAIAGVGGELLRRMGVERGPELADLAAEVSMDPAIAMTLESSGLPPAQLAGMALHMFSRVAALRKGMPKGVETPSVDPVRAREYERLKPWFRNREVPPPGIGEEVADKLAKLRVEMQAKREKETQQKVDATNTVERYPEHIEQLFRETESGRDTIGIPWEVMREIYGEKEPKPGDNLFGDIPDLQSKIDYAERHNIPVEIPTAKLYIARHNNPELAEKLKDNLVYDEGGRTKKQLEELKPAEKEKEEVFLDRSELEEEKKAGRAAEPPPRYTLKEVPVGSLGWKDVALGPDTLVYDIMEGDNKFPAGVVIGELKGGKVRINRIVAHGPSPENRFGPYELRELWKQWLEQHPEAKSVGGFRAKGARIVSGLGPAEALYQVRRATGLDAPFGWEKIEGNGGRSLIHPDAIPGATQVELFPGFKKGTPLWTMSLRDAISMIDPEEAGPEGSFHRNFFDYFSKRISKVAGDIPLHVMDKDYWEEMAKWMGRSPGKGPVARYQYSSDAIFFDPTYMYQGEGHSGPFYVLHEGVHAMTSLALEMFPDLADIAQQMKKETRAYIMDTNPAAMREHQLNYSFLNEHEFLAQGIALAPLREIMANAPMSKGLAELIKGVIKGPEPKNLWEAFKQFIGEALNRVMGGKVEPKMLEGFFQLTTELQKRYELAQDPRVPKFSDIKAKVEGRAAEPPERGEVPRIGLGKKASEESWIKKVIEEEKAKRAWIDEQVKKAGLEEASEEWKERFKETRDEVATRLKGQPTMMLDEAMREGTMGGQKLDYPLRINVEDVTSDERHGIPEYYFSSRGQTVDELAEAFGYETREQLLGSLRDLEAERKLEDLTPQAHFTKMVNQLADRLTRERYGTVDKMAMEAAADHIYSPEVFRKLSGDILETAMRYGDKEPWNETEVKQNELRAFLAGDRVAERTLKDAALRNATAAQDAARDGKFIESIRFKQQQFANLYAASLARKWEKMHDETNRRIKRNNVLERPSIAAEDHIHMIELMRNGGVKVPYSDPQLARQIELVAGGQTLKEHVNQINSQHDIYNQDPDNPPLMNRIPVDERFLEPNRQPGMTPDNMSNGLFQAFHDSLKAMEKWNLDHNKLIVRGKKREVNEIVSGMIPRLKAAVGNKVQPDTDSLLRAAGSWLLTPETWFNRIDLGNKFGPFTQMITRPIMEGQYSLRTLERQFAKKWADLGTFEDFKRPIENPLFKDSEGQLIPMTKGMAYAVLQNMGNELQRRKLVGGWEIVDEALAASDENKELAIQDAIKEVWLWLGKPIEQGGAGMVAADLARAKKMGGIFKEAFDMSQEMYAGLGGAVPNAIDLGSMVTPWGISDEWYSPLVRDPLRSKGVALTAEQLAAEGGGYFRPSPAHGYTMGRTGALYRINLDIRDMGHKLKTVINDVAMRPAISEVSKIVYHQDFKDAFTKYYGKEYFSALDKWLKDAAGNREWSPRNAKIIEKLIVETSRNLSTLYVGLNPVTVGKHVPGALGQSINETSARLITKYALMFLKEMPGARDHWDWAHETSEELQNRWRSAGESISGVGQEIFPAGKARYFRYRDAVERVGHAPIAFFDLVFATAQWLADYEMNAKAHPDWGHGDLVYSANTAVRRTHGSTMIAARPQVLRTSAWVSAAVPLYNFASTFMQRNYEAGWLAKLAFQKKFLGKEVTLPEMKDFAEEKLKAWPAASKALGRIFWSGIAIAAIENFWDPVKQDEDESDLSHYFKVGVMPYSNMMPFLGRDVLSNLIHGRPLSYGGLYTSATQDVPRIRDILKAPLMDRRAMERLRADPGRHLRAAVRIAGTLGLAYDKPMGTTIQYLANVAAGKEEAPSGWDFLHAIHGAGPFWKGTKIEREH